MGFRGPARPGMVLGPANPEAIPPMLHLRCGDDIVPALRRVVPGEVGSWADPLCEGPLDDWPSAEARRAVRSRYLATRYGRPREEVRANLEAADQLLSSAAAHDETVLWFEPDLYDQVILVFLLHTLGTAMHARCSLICIGDHPAVPRFTGLGQLSPEQLASLFPTRAPVTPDMTRAATDAWCAFTAADDRALERLAQDGAATLPFVGAAAERYHAERPGAEGLGRTARWIVEGLAERPRTAGDLFGSIQDLEPRPWLGDAMFYAMIADLAGGERPWVRVPEWFPWGGEPRHAMVEGRGER